MSTNLTKIPARIKDLKGDVGQADPTTGQVLAWNGNAWAPGDVPSDADLDAIDAALDALSNSLNALSAIAVKTTTTYSDPSFISSLAQSKITGLTTALAAKADDSNTVHKTGSAQTVDAVTTFVAGLSLDSPVTFVPNAFGQPRPYGFDSGGDKVVFFYDNRSYDARAGVGNDANLWFKSFTNTGGGLIDFYTVDINTPSLRINGDGSLTTRGPIYGGSTAAADLYFGSTSHATKGHIYFDDLLDLAPNGNLTLTTSVYYGGLNIHGQGAAIRLLDTDGAHDEIQIYSAFSNLYIVNTSTGQILLALPHAGGVGFNGSSGVAKGTITGSRGSNAALASLLTYLASRGDIIDSTT